MIAYINLTSGLEHLLRPEVHHEPAFKLVRIQSSHLESAALWKVIDHLDYGFLIDAAMFGVTLYDCGSRGGKSPEARAAWQGVPWIRYAYAKANALPIPSDIPKQFLTHFDQQYADSRFRKEEGKRKLRYVHKLTQANDLEIVSAASRSNYDGQYDVLTKILKDHYHG